MASGPIAQSLARGCASAASSLTACSPRLPSGALLAMLPQDAAGIHSPPLLGPFSCTARPVEPQTVHHSQL